jgi:hypothetical protein
MPPPGQTVPAASANDMSFAADNLAGVKVVDIRPGLDDFADEFMADGHGDGDSGASPFIPLENVQICAADAGVSDADQDVIDSDFRLGYILQAQTGSIPGFDESLQARPRS